MQRPEIRHEGRASRMKVIIEATAEEIAALVLELQGRRDLAVRDETSIKALAQATYDRQQGLQAQPGN